MMGGMGIDTVTVRTSRTLRAVGIPLEPKLKIFLFLLSHIVMRGTESIKCHPAAHLDKRKFYWQWHFRSSRCVIPRGAKKQYHLFIHLDRHLDAGWSSVYASSKRAC